nr:EOG090X0GO7 [Triops cancriformis]
MSLPARYPLNLSDEVDDEVIHSKNGKKCPQKSAASQESKKELSSTLTHDLQVSSYIDVTPATVLAVGPSTSDREGKMQQLSLRLSKEDDLLKQSVIKPGFEQQHILPPYQEAKKREKIEKRKEREKTKGKSWYDLPATEMTEERKRDLEILQMRSVLDTKQFYKKNDLKVLPKYFQIGKVVDSPVDFYASRIPRKERKRTLVDELMADAKFQNMNKKKYAEIITSKQRPSGAYRHAKRLKNRK